MPQEKLNHLINEQLQKLDEECKIWETLRLYVREYCFKKFHEREQFIIENKKYITSLNEYKNKKLNKISVVYLEDNNEYMVHHYILDASVDNNGRFKYNDKWTNIRWFDEVQSYGHEEDHHLVKKLNIIGFFDIEVNYEEQTYN